jgi:hypothetical protein
VELLQGEALSELDDGRRAAYEIWKLSAAKN